MAKWVRPFEVKEKSIPLRCGYCHCILYGYDETVCPCCRAYNDMDNPRQVTVEPKEYSLNVLDKMKERRIRNG